MTRKSNQFSLFIKRMDVVVLFSWNLVDRRHNFLLVTVQQPHLRLGWPVNPRPTTCSSRTSTLVNTRSVLLDGLKQDHFSFFFLGTQTRSLACLEVFELIYCWF